MYTTSSYSVRYCNYCSAWVSHSIEGCPRVESLEYWQSGKLKRVVLRPELPVLHQGPHTATTVTYRIGSAPSTSPGFTMDAGD